MYVTASVTECGSTGAKCLVCHLPKCLILQAFWEAALRAPQYLKMIIQGDLFVESVGVDGFYECNYGEYVEGTKNENYLF